MTSDPENLDPYGAQNHPLPPMKEKVVEVPTPTEKAQPPFVASLIAARRPLYLSALSAFVYLYFCAQQEVLASLVSGILLLGAVLDAAQRMSDYRSLVGENRDYERAIILCRLRSSWCGRGVLEHYDPACKEALFKSGYRWWHIFPDDAVKVIITRQHWRNAIGI